MSDEMLPWLIVYQTINDDVIHTDLNLVYPIWQICVDKTALLWMVRIQ